MPQRPPPVTGSGPAASTVTEKIRTLVVPFDIDGKGQIPKSLVHELLAAAGLSPTPSEVQTALNEVAKQHPNDSTSSSWITLQILNAVATTLAPKVAVEKNIIIEWLKQLDFSSTNHIDVAVLHHLLQTYGERFSTSKADAVLQALRGSTEGPPTAQQVAEELVRLSQT